MFACHCIMRRAYKFRMRPTARQHVALAACVDSHRELYNAALQERRGAWAQNKTRIWYTDQAAQLSEIREERPDVAVWSYASQQATLRRLNRAFDAFSAASRPARRPGIRGLKVGPVSTVLSGPEMQTAAAGIPIRRAYICKASARSRSALIARWQGESRPFRFGGRAVTGC